tara:strand:- start:1634 stop:1831 length:198 start_codon:yes stop_codon:yes gene_type:complete
MSKLNLETLDDGQIKVCLTENQVTACCYVSSMHLVDEKEKQLQQSIARQKNKMGAARIELASAEL